jgi:hypothetical protein
MKANYLSSAGGGTHQAAAQQRRAALEQGAVRACAVHLQLGHRAARGVPGVRSSSP